jgi:exodeoxyribonuclease VII small subunit
MARSTPDSPADVGTLTYEQARDELIEIVSKLEAGAATLDESLALWERGEALAARCQELLDGASDRIAAARVDVASDEAIPDDAADAGVVMTIAADEEDEEDAT